MSAARLLPVPRRAVPASARGAGFVVPALLLAALVLLVAAQALTPAVRDQVSLACILLLGVPHGALDGEVARPLLRPRFGSAWFAIFAVPYLGLAAGVLLCWRIAPLPTLAVFLAGSVWHFGAEDAGPRALAATARGGLVVAAPVLLHPAATALFLGSVSRVPMQLPPGWLVGACLLWCVPAASWMMQSVRKCDWFALADAALVAGLFAGLSPLSAFAAYFVCLHAPRHMRALAASRLAPRVRTLTQAMWRSLPVTALTFLIGAALWGCYSGPASSRLLCLTIQGLAALTLPHMLLNAFAERYVNDHADQPGG